MTPNSAPALAPFDAPPPEPDRNLDRLTAATDGPPLPAPTWVTCVCGQDILLTTETTTCLACERTVESRPTTTGTCLVCDRYGDVATLESGHHLCERCDRDARTSNGHGALAAFTGRCTCVTCLNALEEARGWVQQRVEGVSLADIGADAGLTRERIRQVTDRLAPHKPWKAVEAIDRIERTTIEQVRDNAKVACLVCGDESVPLRSGRRYCTARCREIQEALAWHTDANRRESNRRAMARWTLDNPDLHTDATLAHARRVLDGEAVSNPARRWLIKGSDTFRIALEARRNGWPISEQLPESVRTQLDDHIEQAAA